MKRLTLGDVCKKASSNIAQKDLQDKMGVYPIYGASGLIKQVDFYQQDKEYIAVVKDGAGIGRTMLLPAYSSVIGTMQYLLPKEGIPIDIKYLFYAVEHMNLAKYFSGATIPHIYFKDYQKEPINIPDIDTQRKISRIFDKIDALVTSRKEQRTKLDQIVMSRFIEMFGDPITNEMGWEKVQLSTCIESIDNGKSLVCDTSARQGNWPAVLKLSAATYGFYRPEENKAMLDENQFVEDAAVRAGDLLFTRKNTPELVGMCAYVYDTPSRLMMPDLIFRLNTTNRCNKVFLWKLINHNLFRDCIRAISTGSAKSMSNISKERLLNLEIILPPAELQEQFAVFVAQIDKSKYRQEKCIGFFQCLEKTLDRSGYDVEFWLSQNEKRI